MFAQGEEFLLSLDRTSLSDVLSEHKNQTQTTILNVNFHSFSLDSLYGSCLNCPDLIYKYEDWFNRISVGFQLHAKSDCSFVLNISIKLTIYISEAGKTPY